jgi:hypothetical protein
LHAVVTRVAWDKAQRRNEEKNNKIKTTVRKNNKWDRNDECE